MKNKKNIWCISKYASPPHHGVGARLFYVAREFSEMDFENVLLISSDSNHLAKYPATEKIYNLETYGQLKHLWIKTLKYGKSASLKRFMSWFDFEVKLFKLKKKDYPKPDIVIISSLSLFSIVYGIFLKRKFKCKLVFEIRDIYPLTLVEEFKVNKFNPMVIILGFLEKIGYKKADLIVGTMPNLKEHVNEVVKTQANVFYSPLGIHEIWNKEQTKSELIDSLFPVEDRFIVGYAGSMGISNALEPFIDAIKKMAAEKEVYFVLVGAGDLKESFQQRLAGLSNVTIGPKIKQEEIPYFLSKCDLLYLSAHDSKIWKYGQSLNKLIDYMMAGKPVVASYSGFPSMLNEADAGLFIPIGDTEYIVKAIQNFKKMDIVERENYGKRGRAWVMQNHDYKNIAQNYYNEIMQLFEIEN